MPIINPCVNGYRYDRDKALKDYPWTKQKLNYMWNWAKDHYIDKGVHPHDAIVQTAHDLGYTPEEVLHGFNQNKTFRQMNNQMYLDLSRRRTAVQFAKQTLMQLRQGKIARARDFLWQTPFALKVAGHGTVGMQTHAGGSLFRPSTWFTANPNRYLFNPLTWGKDFFARTPGGDLMGYFPNFWRQFQYSFGEKPFLSLHPLQEGRAFHERKMMELMNRPNFALARRAGLANDPTHVYTDYGFFAQFLPKYLGRDVGQRGFDVLKVFRQDQFDHEWGLVSDTIKADPKAALEHAKEIANLVNHDTGVLRKGEESIIAEPFTAKWTQKVAFAARLEGSRWQRFIGDPAKTLDIYARQAAGRPVTDSERFFAKRNAIRAAEFTASYFMGLLINDALQKAAGSKNRINFFDPSRPDFWANKMGDHTAYIEGRVLAPVRLVARLIQATWYPKPYEKREEPFIRGVKIAGYYARGKLSPAAELATETYTGRSYSGRPLPWAKGQKPTPGKPREGWIEYGSTFAPIPAEGVVRDIYDSMRHRGMSHVQATDVIQSLGTFAMEMMGVGYYKTPTKRPTHPGAKSEFFTGTREYRP